MQYQMNRVKREQEAIYKTIRQLQQGELTYEELSEEDRERLDAFKDVEQALLDSLSEGEKLKLGLFERKFPAAQALDPVEMPKDDRESKDEPYRGPMKGLVKSLTDLGMELEMKLDPVEMPEDYRAGGRVRLI